MTRVHYIGLDHDVPMLTNASVNKGSDSASVCLEPAVTWEITIDSPETQPCKVHYLYVCVVLSALAIMRRRKELRLPNEKMGSFAGTTASTLDQCMFLLE